MTELTRLRELTQSRAVTIGVAYNAANNYWSRTSALGKVANWGTYAVIGAVIFTFIRWRWYIGFLGVALLVVYIKAINWASALAARMDMLADPEIFDLFYENGAATIRVNASGEILRYPTDWREVVKSGGEIA